MGSTEGVGVSSLVSVSAFGAMRSEGVDFVIARGFRSTGSVDTNVAATVANAWNAGMSRVDVYHSPCYSCGNAGGQANTLVTYLTDKGVKYGKVWLEVEGPGSQWGSSTSANAAFIADWFRKMEQNGVDIGVRTLESHWVPIVGSSYTGGSAFPLWYAHHDGKRSFDDFTPFGGWTEPSMKAYTPNSTLAGTSVERFWYPS